MTLQYSLYLGINILGRKVFHAYYYRSNVPHAVRAYGAATTAAYCYDAVTVLPRCRNSFIMMSSSGISFSCSGVMDVTKIDEKSVTC
jgi:hypothetical protein